MQTASLSTEAPHDGFNTVLIPGGKSLRGTDSPIYPVDGEGPLRCDELEPYLMTSTVITNGQFEKFVLDTGYLSEAERFGWSFVFRGAVLDKNFIDAQVATLPWWCKIYGADWRRPKGPGSDIDGQGNFPVVQVSWNDAVSFASWAGGRLPNEAEWEHAARGGLGDVLYPWGNVEPTLDDPKCHIGQIDSSNCDPINIGPIATDAHGANGYGLFNLVGNVWEWVGDEVLHKDRHQSGSPPQFLLKGGSYLCHRKYCYRYRIAARISNTTDSALGHTGFRIVFSLTSR
jgi:sulfatase modifying factor 1